MSRFALVQEPGTKVLIIDRITGSRERVDMGIAMGVPGTSVHVDTPHSLPSQKVCAIAT
jgi:hypothetical protein